jgi:hypothetical protein
MSKSTAWNLGFRLVAALSIVSIVVSLLLLHRVR